MVKGRKLALVVTGIGALSFSVLGPSFIPAVFGRTSRQTDSRTDWQAEFSSDIDDIDIREQYIPVSVVPPRHRIPSKNVDVLAALGAISLDKAQALYNEAARGNKYARTEIANIRRKAKATHTVPRRSAAMKRKLAWNMKEVERARKLSDTGMLSVEDARSTVALAFSGSLLAQYQIRQIRQTMKRALARVTLQKAAALAGYGKMSVKEAESMYAKAEIGNLDARAAIRQMRSAARTTPVVASHKQTGRLRRRLVRNMKEIKRAGKLSDTGLLSVDEARSLVVRSRRASLLAQHTIRDIRERAQLQKTFETVDADEIYEAENLAMA